MLWSPFLGFYGGQPLWISCRPAGALGRRVQGNPVEVMGKMLPCRGKCLFLQKNTAMPFEDYHSHQGAVVRPSLLWEYDLNRFDWQSMRNIVVQRVLERGRMDDFYAILNLYGEEGVKDALRNIPYMNDKDMNFACIAFNLKKEELKCFTRKQSRPQHWNS